MLKIELNDFKYLVIKSGTGYIITEPQLKWILEVVEKLQNEIESITREGLETSKQLVDSNAIEGSNQKRYERAESKILQLEAEVTGSAEVIKQYEIDVAGYIDDVHMTDKRLTSLRDGLRHALRDKHYHHEHIFNITIEECNHGDCLIYKKALEEGE